MFFYFIQMRILFAKEANFVLTYSEQDEVSSIDVFIVGSENIASFLMTTNFNFNHNIYKQFCPLYIT